MAASDQPAGDAASRDPGADGRFDVGVEHIARVYNYWLGGQDQFLDIGTGLPTANNTHEVAQATAADSRIVYVDKDRCKSGCVRACRAEGESGPTGWLWHSAAMTGSLSQPSARTAEGWRRPGPGASHAPAAPARRAPGPARAIRRPPLRTR